MHDNNKARLSKHFIAYQSFTGYLSTGSRIFFNPISHSLTHSLVRPYFCCLCPSYKLISVIKTIIMNKAVHYYFIWKKDVKYDKLATNYQIIIITVDFYVHINEILK